MPSSAIWYDSPFVGHGDVGVRLRALTEAEAGIRTNRHTNPRATSTTGYTNVSLTSMTAVTLDGVTNPGPLTLPDGSTVTTAIKCVSDANLDELRYTFPFTTTSGTQIRGAAYVWISSLTATGIDCRIRDGSAVSQADSADISTTGAWTRINVAATPGAAAANWSFNVTQVGTGAAAFYVTASLVEETAAALGTYFDGSMHASRWLGTANASETQTATNPAVEIMRRKDQAGQERYEVVRLREKGSGYLGSRRNYQIDGMAWVAPYKSVPYDDASVTAIGGTITKTVKLLSYNGGYGPSTVVNRAVEWTVPTGDPVTYLGIRTSIRTNGGLVLVSIGGDFTKANQLPTVQELINKGSISSSVLGKVLSSHTVAANDRILDLSPPVHINTNPVGTAEVMNFHVCIHEGAPVNGQKVRFTNLAESNLEHANTPTMYVEAFTYGGPKMTRSTTGCALLTHRQIFHRVSSAKEYANRAKPAGASADALVGTFHGYDGQNGELTIKIDNTTRTLQLDGPSGTGTENGAQWGTSVDVTRQSTLYSPNLAAGATGWANVTTDYLADKNKFTTSWVLTHLLNTDWTADGSYLAMHAVEGWIFSRGTERASATVRDFVGDDSRPYVQSNEFMLWDPAGDQAVHVKCATSSYVGIQDNAVSASSGAPNSKTNKAYFPQSPTPVTINRLSGSTLSATCEHRSALLSDPDALLSRPVGAGSDPVGSDLVVLDAVPINIFAWQIDRTELHLNAGSIRVAQDPGIDWGDAAIEAYMADLARGNIPVDFRIPSRQITIPLILGEPNDPEFSEARSQLRAKVALLQREGGWIKRGTGRYADIVNATLKEPDRTGHLGYETNVELVLEAIPDFYADEQFLNDHVAVSGAGELVFTETGIDGDHPSRVRVVVDNDSTNDLKGLIYGVRSRNYSSEQTAALAYEAEALTPLDVAVVSALAGSSGGSSVRCQPGRDGWVSMLSTDIVGVGSMTHVGTYRMWVRVTTNAPDFNMQLVYGVGDLTRPEENPVVTVPDSTDLYRVINLGEVRLDPSPVGSHQWSGRIQVKRPDGIDAAIRIDKVWMVPADDAYGALTAPQVLQVPPGFTAYDSFAGTTAGGTLNTRTAPAGGSWATSGATTDFAFSDDVNSSIVGLPDEPLKRATVSDTGPRYAVLSGTIPADATISAFVGHTAIAVSGGIEQGVIARWTNASNHLRGKIQTAVINGFRGPVTKRSLILEKVVGGTPTLIASGSASTDGTLQLQVRSNGLVTLSIISGGVLVNSIAVTSTDLATGGALASGIAGLYDYNALSVAVTRYYSDVAVDTGDRGDAVIYKGRSIELRTDGHYREGSNGTGGSRVPFGDLLRIPPAGLEGRTVQMVLIPVQGDLDTSALSGLDNLSARVVYRPSWLFPAA